jgi:hypothetical protein
MHVIPAANAEIVRNVPVDVLTRQVDTAHVGAVAEDAGEAQAAALLAGFNHFDHLTALRVIQVP